MRRWSQTPPGIRCIRCIRCGFITFTACIAYRGRGYSHLMPGANEVRMEVAARATTHRLLGMDLVTLGKHSAEPVRRESLTYRAFLAPDARVSDH